MIVSPPVPQVHVVSSFTYNHVAKVLKRLLRFILIFSFVHVCFLPAGRVPILLSRSSGVLRKLWSLCNVKSHLFPQESCHPPSTVSWAIKTWILKNDSTNQRSTPPLIQTHEKQDLRFFLEDDGQSTLRNNSNSTDRPFAMTWGTLPIIERRKHPLGEEPEAMAQSCGAGIDQSVRLLTLPQVFQYGGHCNFSSQKYLRDTTVTSNRWWRKKKKATRGRWM